MMRPDPRLAICLAMPWVSSSGPVTLTSNWWRMLSPGMSTVEPPSPTPALLTRISMPQSQGLAAVAVVGDVELLDLQGHPTLAGLSLQGLHLAVDLDGGHHLETLLGQSHCDLVSEAGSGSGDEHLLQTRGAHGHFIPLIGDDDGGSRGRYQPVALACR